MKFLDEDSVQSYMMQIMRLNYVRLQELLENTGAHHGQPPVLFALYKENGLSQKELANRINVKPATITVTLQGMEKSGMVKRKQDERDKRITRIYLTERGVEVCKKACEVTEILEKESTANFTREELIILRRLLMQMRDNLKIVVKKGDMDLSMKCHNK